MLNEQQQRKIEAMLKALEGFVASPEEVAETVKLNIELLKELRIYLEDKLASEHSEFKKEVLRLLIEKVSFETEKAINPLKNKLARLEEKPDLALVERKIKDLESTFNKILSAEIKSVKKEIPEQIIETPETVREKLEALQGEKRLDKKAIKGLQEELETLKKEVKEASKTVNITGSVGGGTRAASVQFHDLSSQLDGVTKTFTLPKFKKIIGVWASSAPWVFRPTVDYTLSGNAITFTSEIEAASILATGQSVIVLYGQLFGP